MKGQWIGRTIGVDAQIILNIDDRGSYYSGVAYIIPDDRNTPAMAVIFKTSNKDRNFNFKAEILPINPETGFKSTWTEVEHFYPSIVFAQEAYIEGRFEKEELFLAAKTVLGIKVSAQLNRKISSIYSEINSKELTGKVIKMKL